MPSLADVARTYYTAVGGTHSYADVGMPQRRWYQSGSDFTKYAEKYNCYHLFPDQGFVWTTDLGGIQFWRRWRIWFGRISNNRDHRDWIAGGENLLVRFFVKGFLSVPFELRNLITHSHGLQVFIYACRAAQALNVPKPFFRNVIDVAGPARADTLEVYKDCQDYVKNHVHLYDPTGDRIARWGQFGDADLRTDRRILLPNVQNIGIEGISHSKSLNEAKMFEIWTRNHLFAQLAAE